MRVIICILVSVLFSNLQYAQESDSNFKVHSVSLAPNYYTGNSSNGFLANADLVFSQNNLNLFKVSVMGASESSVCVMGPCRTDEYQSYSLMYGREFLSDKGVGLDLFAGAGYFQYKTKNQEPYERGYKKENTIGFPIQGRVRFRNGKAFNLGVQLHANINSASSIFAIGPFFQWNFHPKNKIKSVN